MITDKVKINVDLQKVEEIKKDYLKEIKLGTDIFLSPKPVPIPEVTDAIRKVEPTMYDGDVMYLKYWNYWVRAGVRGIERFESFFPDYENTNERIFDMIDDIGISPAPSYGERHIWEKISTIWSWFRLNAVYGPEASDISTHVNWPSIDDYAAYYETNGNIAVGTCFSKAHLFATLLGRAGINRWRIAIAKSHHTVGGAPPTATHVFVIVYVAGEWFYLDPTFAYAVSELPEFEDRASVGLFEAVDYAHPYGTVQLPLAGFDRVPLLVR